MSDTLGRRWFFIVGNLIALIGTIVCCTAHSIRVVIIGMTFSGVGAASQQLALAAAAEIFPNKYRGYVQGKVLQQGCLDRRPENANTGSLCRERTNWLYRLRFAHLLPSCRDCNLAMGILYPHHTYIYNFSPDRLFLQPCELPGLF